MVANSQEAEFIRARWRSELRFLEFTEDTALALVVTYNLPHWKSETLPPCHA